jgi:hypothetical protein
MSISSVGSQSTNWYQTQGITQAQSLAQGSPTGGASLFDYLDISDEGQAAADALPQTTFDPNHAPGILTPDEINAVGQKIQKALAKSGIDSAGEVKLEIDATGHARVIGDHPQKAEIEQLFVDHPELRNDLAHASASLSANRAFAEAVEFQTAYAKDPEAAVAQYSYLFNPAHNSGPMEMLLKGGELTAVETGS